MANRRFGMGGGGGGGGPQQRGGFVRNFSQPSANVSPWQGGVAPGNTGNALQTQIALALSSLLQQNQAPSQRADGPPSLLSMNTPSPTFFNPNHGANFNNANRFNNMNNRGRQDFRRNDNFNKNRAGWRSSDNNNRANNRGSGSNRNQRTNNQRSSTANARSSQDSKDNKDKKQTPIDKTSAIKSEKSEASASLTDDDVREDEKEDEKEDTKRDWKTEKKGDDSEDLVDLTDEKTNLKKEKEKEKEKDKDKDKDSVKVGTSKFDGLPRSFLHCFVCNKSMWDGESFQNHIRGKAHKQMIVSLEDSFQSTVNILRENMRVAEERRVIEMQRMQRSRRFHHNSNNEAPSHCNMCNHKFLGKIVVHRQSRGHQRLKRFLHPNCKCCNAEFPSRMEWVDHLFTSEHLLTAKRALDEKGDRAGEYKVEDIEYDILPIMEESMQNEDESPVLEITDDLGSLFNRIPAFKPGRAVSTQSIKSSTGFICDLCNTFMNSEEDSQNHLKSEVHYHRFVEAVKKLFMREGNKDKAKKRKSEDAADEEEDDEDAEGKQKNEEEIEDENDIADETLASTDVLKDEDSDMYDPFANAIEKAVDEDEDDDSAEVEENVANSTANPEDSGTMSLYSSAIESDTSANTTLDASAVDETTNKPPATATSTATRGTGKARRGGGPPAPTSILRNGSPRSKRIKK